VVYYWFSSLSNLLLLSARKEKSLHLSDQIVTFHRKSYLSFRSPTYTPLLPFDIQHSSTYRFQISPILANKGRRSFCHSRHVDNFLFFYWNVLFGFEELLGQYRRNRRSFGPQIRGELFGWTRRSAIHGILQRLFSSSTPTSLFVLARSIKL